MPLFLLNMFKSKGTYIALMVVIALGYHYFTVSSLESTIEKRDIKIEKLEVKLIKVELNFDTCKSNFEDVANVNRSNNKIITECVAHTEKLSGDYVDIIKSKDNIINKLRADIVAMNIPIDYPEEVVFEECVIKIKGAKDAKIGSTFNSLNNIGN